MFRTELELSPSGNPLRFDQPMLTIGSCFSECIGRKLVMHKLNVLSNPFGTVFNPLSISKLMGRAILNKPVASDELVEYQGVWSHYDFHSTFSGQDKEIVCERLNRRLKEVHDFLERCEVIMITFGTSFIYRKESDNTLVANCHKHPSQFFNRSLLSVDEIISDFAGLANELPGKRFLLTVSPVRHTRDTLPLNNLSKSILRVACQGIIDKVPGASYFPSLEIMHDDLRDYRFYDNDLIHPNSMGEQYIWDKFVVHYFTGADNELITTIAQLNRKLAHKPNHPGSLNHTKFLKNLMQGLKEMNGKVDYSVEIAKLRLELEAEK